MRMSPNIFTRVNIALTLIAVTVSTWLILKLREVRNPPKDDLKGQTEENDTSSCSDCQALSAQYKKMEDEFISGGLNLASIRAIQPWFHGVHGSDMPWPKRYEVFPEPLPPRAVRLLVIPLEGSTSLASVGSAITRDMLGILPASAKVFSNARTHYHCTVWHTSHPSDTRPDPFAADGGLSTDLASSSPGQRPTVRQAVLDAEVAALKREVQATAPPTLVIDRVLMASSGTLLITWVDPTGRVAELRQRLRGVFPGACTRQATIIHTSLLRVISDEQLSPESVHSIKDVCETWTRKLKGRTMVPEATWWIHEGEFSTIFGDKVHFRFKL